MLDTRALLSLALAPSELAHFAERCYAGGYEALENDDSERAALLFAVVALMNPKDPRAWRGLARAADEHSDAAAGLESLAEALRPTEEALAVWRKVAP